MDFQSLEKIDRAAFPIKSQQTIFKKIHCNKNALCSVAHTYLTGQETHSFSPSWLYQRYTYKVGI